ncbi:MAG: hypothetical protein GEV08_12275 [Acidimicrobiia bacterium]|nr:hypothetical protein [Acidimicrobiia bacterium]
MRRSLSLCVVLAGLSVLVVRPAPSYDPWAWLLWGGEVLDGRLDTVAGPAFKPLPVAVCTLLATLGSAAPWAWVLLARAAAAVALWLVFRLGRRLAGGSLLAGALAVGAAALCGPFLDQAAAGLSEPMLVALALAGAEAARVGRPRWALACAVGVALLRVESWPFLVVLGLVAWRRRPGDRPLLVVAAALVPLAWFLPELVGSGDLLRSASRAQVPNPGQPALADVPALASLREAVALPLWPLWVGVGVLAWLAGAEGDSWARRALVPAAVGAAWALLVAVMAQAGFSGEPRYAVPGAALVAVSGAVGLVLGVAHVAGRPGAPALAVSALLAVLAVAGEPRVGALSEMRRSQAYQWALQADLAAAVQAAGGTEEVLECGQPYVGPLRGPLMAYRLEVAKHQVEPDLAPRAPGVVFRSAIHVGASPAPAVPSGFEPVAHVGTWEVFARCWP